MSRPMDEGLLAAAMVLRAAERVADRLRAIPPNMRHESETELVEAMDRMRRVERGA